MRIADTSAIYAAFVANDAHHGKARQAMAEDDPILIPGEVFVESIALLQYRQGFEAAQAAGTFLLHLPHVSVRPSSASVTQAAWRLFAESDGALSLPDSYVVASCSDAKAPALAFDREILRRTSKGRHRP